MQLYSKDLNAGGRISWLGVPMSNDALIKCFAGFTDTEPDFDTGMDMSAWDTEDGKKIDLAWMAKSNYVHLVLLLFTSLLIIV